MRELCGCAVAMVVLLGCGSGNSVMGTVGGKALRPAEAVYLRTTSSQVTVVLSDQGGICQRLKSGQRLSGQTVLAIHLLSSGAPVAQGTYTVASGEQDPDQEVLAQFEKSDASCASEFGINEGPLASAGTVELTGYAASGSDSASGTFDLSFGSDQLSGAFNAAFCDHTSLNSEAGRVCRR
jgi:hypothetical protein